MTRTKSPHTNALAAKELRSLTSSFLVVRMLNQIADEPVDAARLHERLRAKDTALNPASLNHTLARLRRHGWLRTRGSLHTLTPAGRNALKLAASALERLAAQFNRPA